MSKDALLDSVLDGVHAIAILMLSAIVIVPLYELWGMWGYLLGAVFIGAVVALQKLDIHNRAKYEIQP